MVELVIVALGALVVGLVIGWLFASRRGVAELAAAKVHADQHELTRQQLLAVTAERDTTMRALDAHQATSRERETASWMMKRSRLE